MRFKTHYLVEGKKGIGYKVVDYADDKSVSKADKRVNYEIEPNAVYQVPYGQELWLGSTEEYVKDFYWSGSEDPEDIPELLLTFEYDYDDVIKGNPDEKLGIGATEFAVSKAVLKHATNLSTGEELF